MLRGKNESWSNVSVTLEEDSKRIMGADITMLERRSVEISRYKQTYKSYNQSKSTQFPLTNEMGDGGCRFGHQSVQNLL